MKFLLQVLKSVSAIRDTVQIISSFDTVVDYIDDILNNVVSNVNSFVEILGNISEL